ncbi:hypothetical protein HGRIS_001286 [Hohenbuehelia grisea]|uniref:Uncharacterized protein n=1 Tax=Hohenbuehelia grisea TaxID=104357 RepID=A0ABR3JQ58_9AGAR
MAEYAFTIILTHPSAQVVRHEEAHSPVQLAELLRRSMHLHWSSPDTTANSLDAADAATLEAEAAKNELLVSLIPYPQRSISSTRNLW